MAKKTEETKAVAVVVSVADLAKETGMDPKKIRALIRSLGFNAPVIAVEGFGPRTKYEFEPSSKTLVDIRLALNPNIEGPTDEVPKTEKKGSKTKKTNIELPVEHID